MAVWRAEIRPRAFLGKKTVFSVKLRYRIQKTGIEIRFYGTEKNQPWRRLLCLAPFTSRIELTVLGGRIPNYRRLAISVVSLRLRYDLYGSRVVAEWLHAKPCLRLVILRNLVVADLDTKHISDSGNAIGSLGNALQPLFSNVDVELWTTQ